jgi:hypothetical protein
MDSSSTSASYDSIDVADISATWAFKDVTYTGTLYRPIVTLIRFSWEEEESQANPERYLWNGEGRKIDGHHGFYR